MSCDVCRELDKATNKTIPHVIRVCEECGGDYAFRDEANYGLAFNVEKGDKVVIPESFIKISANPLKSSGQMTIHGIEWFAEMVFGFDIANSTSRGNFLEALEKIQEQNEKLFKDADWLKDLNLESEENESEVIKRFDERKKTIEWWGYMAAVFNAVAADAIRNGDASLAAWAMASAERFRSLAIFKENFAEVVLMGNSASRIVKLINIWDHTKDRPEEGYWQQILTENSFALSQLFAAPVTFIQGNAYVGGTQMDGKDARYLDFMLSGGNANSAVLIEIKTPSTKLLGPKYRKNVFVPSKDLSGAIVQIADYTEVLRKNVETITRERDIELNTFNPRRIILIGNHEAELNDKRARESFELFRTSLAGIEIVTFDEFFRKLEQLLALFNLSRKREVGNEGTIPVKS